ncbi:hypothetical protein DY000_02044173 [Brassica cretica]|uniref:Clu domain-containing protein n=1 Tax=Brassica cretica TaxID=69181 RepID=A0ABQ7EYP0_BRACR|nr:hypothetical protein DY000_02044173 [Brassica cretica]
MAPKNNRGKTKGDKKKKEEKVLPVMVDVIVNLPDETEAILKGISTDRIIDVRRLLSVNFDTCHVTNYSLSHEVRGSQLKDTVDVSALKPCVLMLTEEDYNEGTAMAHVRRLLDVVACTTCFGPSPEKFDSVKNAQAKGGGKNPKQTETSPPPSPAPKDAVVDEAGETSHSFPKLGSFYEFFSLAHLTPPLQYVRLVGKRETEDIAAEDHLLSIDVKLCNGKLVHVEGCRKGFYSVGKQRIICHNLVDLLRQISRAFDNAYSDLLKAFSERNKAYSDLLKAFSERNKFGNLPYGFRANTWLIPPSAAQSPAAFPPLPVEDERWGGDGGGQGRDGRYDLVPWANEFAFIASMPCKTVEERQLRDRKVFLLHNLFVDVATFRAIKAVQKVMADPVLAEDSQVLYSETVGDLSVTVTRDTSNASSKVDTKIDGIQATGLDKTKLMERNLLKGLTADENTAAHDVATLGTISLKYCGYISVVKIEKENEKLSPPSQIVDLLEQPEGGANALNINSLRFLLHKSSPEQNKKTHQQQDDELTSSREFVSKMLEESLVKLEEEEIDSDNIMRWELGACWIQHLQDQKNTEKDKKQTNEKSKNELKVEGLGKPLKSLNSNKKKTDASSPKAQQTAVSSQVDTASSEADNAAITATSQSDAEKNAQENVLVLKNLLSEAAFTRLQESDTGLHDKSLQELVDLAQKYYTEVAIPKLVADFGSLELSPVDGRTLTDFMHTRGLRMRSLGYVVKLSDKLSHVQSLCVHEMIVRALKHILQAVISAVATDTDKIAAKVAAALNMMLGIPKTEAENSWNVGIELIPRDFDMESPEPFQKTDVVSLVPVHKATIYQQKALDINERELGLDHPDTMKSYGDLAVFYYRLQHTELALKYVKRALYLLHLTCGPSHPNTAATYINVAMMEEGLGNVHVALRYLHKALKCNQRLLGPDHIQTAASYHAIAIALSLMEAYHLSVQHEQTTLRILRAKLGPDDLRTQDAAAWLEYFESKAFEQQEAARNGTPKPDASIASKGHLSVSDLLDYINPSHNAKGKQSVAAKRKSYMKLKEKSNQNVVSEQLAETPRENQKEMSEEETEATGSEDGQSSDANQETILASAEEPPSPPVIDEATMDNSNSITSAEVSTETQHPDGSEDGWQPVHRPRSAGSYGRRLKQRRASIGKVYTYQKKNVEADNDNPVLQNATQANSKYYVLKKRTASSANYGDHHSPGMTTQGTKFGRKVVKTLAYRVKSMQPSSENPKTSAETSEEDGLKTDASPAVPSGLSSNVQNEAYPKNSVVSLGKSPSYKEVALAPPGSIAKYQVWAPQAEASDKQEENKSEEGTSVELTRDEQMITVSEEEVKNEISADAESSKPQGKEEIKVELQSSEVEFKGNNLNENEESGGGIQVEEPVLEANEGVTDMIHSTTEQEVKDQLAADSDDLKEKLGISATDSSDAPRELLLPNKKLSASAVPFNPSSPPSIIRPTPIGMNIGPSWPVNMIHHGPPTFPSPPTTPNLMQPMSFVYPPPYTQSVPTSTYPVTSGPFHPNPFQWQHMPEFVPRTVWPGCHPVEFSPPHMIAPEPIASTVLEPTVILPTDIDTSAVEEGKQDVAATAGETMDSVNHVNVVASSEMENGNKKFEEGEKTFSILLRGRRNRKQTLRMPISLLNRPYDSQPFKIAYSRVIRGSEAPKSAA